MSIYTILVTIFCISEVGLYLSKRSKTTSAKSQTDKSSMLLLWIAIPVSLTVGGFISGYGFWVFGNIVTVTYIGLGIAILGFIIRWTAIFQLGKMFTVDVSISSTHKLNTAGLYKIVRHPSYLGLTLIIAGLALCMGSILALIVVLLLFFIAMNYRINVEEQALTDEFGIQYLEYKKRVAKIIPLIY